MRLVFRLITFMLAFTLEVHVKAEEGLVKQPENCIQAPCAVKNISNRTKVFEYGKSKLRGGPGTVLIDKGGQGPYFMAGDILVLTNKNPIQIMTLYGRVQFQPGQIGQLKIKKDHLEVKAFKGTLSLIPRGSGEKLKLPEGFYVKVEGIDRSGRNQIELPQVVHPKDLVKGIGRFYHSRKKVVHILESIKPGWRSAVVSAGLWQKDIARRRIAAVKQKREQRRKWRQKKAAEREEILQLFRKKNHLVSP